jgi:hypothetical protein
LGVLEKKENENFGADRLRKIRVQKSFNGINLLKLGQVLYYRF